MELFIPSQKTIEFICNSNEKPLASYFIYPFDSDRRMGEFAAQNFVCTLESIIHFYRKDKVALNEESKKRMNVQEMFYVVGELFKNWIDHAPENSNLITGLFLGAKGVCYGFNDGGDFFKNPKIKKQIENKVLFKEFDKNPRIENSNCNAGFNEYIYPYSDLIEVDSEKGIIYCAQLKENLIAPEGEVGSDYFYHLRKKKGLIRD